jgi:hypothetical protein
MSSTKYVYSMYKIPYNSGDWNYKLVLTLIRSEFTNSLFSEINQNSGCTMGTFESNTCREYLISCRKWLSYIYLVILCNPTYSNGRPIVFYVQRLKKYNNENSDMMKYDYLHFPRRTF